MAQVRGPGAFNDSLLPEGQKRWRSFGAGLGLECAALAALLVVPLLMPQRFEMAPHYWVMPLEAPVIQPWKPQPPPVKKVVKPEVIKEVVKVVKPAPVVIPKPKIYDPVITSPIAKITQRKVAPAPEVAKALPDISMGSSAIPTLKKPRAAVQTGGFGDPNGLPDNGKRDRNPNIALQGSFDMPAGPGNGNGTGGKNGAKGVVASAGFGNGTAIGGGGGNHGAVQQGSFASEQATSGPQVKQTAAVSNTKPVEILFVPKPTYTDEGRAKKVEGDVLLQVVFTASGQVQVERIVRGLGYGLDEAAEAAARQIRFHPAEQDGRPVDFDAIAHITFQLAY